MTPVPGTCSHADACETLTWADIWHELVKPGMSRVNLVVLPSSLVYLRVVIRYKAITHSNHPEAIHGEPVVPVLLPLPLAKNALRPR